MEPGYSYGQGSAGYIWSNLSGGENTAYYIVISDSALNMSNYNKVDGRSLRCVTI